MYFEVAEVYARQGTVYAAHFYLARTQTLFKKKKNPLNTLSMQWQSRNAGRRVK